MAEKFDISFRSLNGRKSKVSDGKLQLIRQCDKTTEHFLMHLRVSHDTLLADFFLSGFKLRLD